MATGLHAAGGLAQQRVGSYVLRQWLAQGGMAELYLATPADPARGTDVAVVKRVLPQFSQDAQFVRMFAREAQLASALKHPNIVEVFEAHAEGTDECYFAMEYVHGPDLSEILRTLKESETPMPIAHALTVAAGICAGLGHAHDHHDETGQALGIVHRDVSPSNVMIAHDGTIKLMDFGVAKALALTSFTQAGTRKGKLSYMSPEQAVADPVDRRTDIFAIGAVLFEMTTMQRMLGGDNELAVMHKLLFRERPKPSELKPGYPPDLERLVLRAVAQDPANRFQTASEMQQEIEQFAARNGIRLSPTALANWVANIVPPKPHPASDPSFFAGPTPSAASRETTVAEGPQTLADHGVREDVTALDGPVAMPTAVGHMVANEPGSGVARPHQPLAPVGAVIVNPMRPGGAMEGTPAPTPVHPSGSVAAMPGPRTSAAPHGAMHSTTTGVRGPAAAGTGVIIGIAALIAASVVGGAVWYTRGGPDPAQAPVASSPEEVPEADEQPAVAAPAPTPEQVPVVSPSPAPAEAPPAPTPTPAPAPTAVPEAPPPGPTEAALAEPEAPAAQPEAAPAPAEPTPSRRDKPRKKKERRKRSVDRPAEEATAPAKPEKTPPPPPPPPPRKKSKAPTDTLLPIEQ